MNEIALIGSTPPPIGGVTIHIQRLLYYGRQRNVPYRFIEARKNTLFQYFIDLVRGCSNCKILHYQLNNWYEAFFISQLFRNKKILYTVHSFPNDSSSFNVIKRIMFRSTCNNVEYFIAPSETIKKALIGNGISEKKVIVINTYLPPTDTEIEADVPEELLREFNNENKIILASASKIYKADGVDVYGLDLCIEACKKLDASYKFIFCVSGECDEEYLRDCENRIKEYGLTKRFVLYRGSVLLPAIYKYCDLFVRPTNTDSFGISIAEAIDCGIPVVASNVCERAKGTNVFSNRDLASFISAIIENTGKKGERIASANCLDELIFLYRRIMEK